MTKKEKPLWLTYRELADNELRKAANELLREDYPLDDPSIDDYEKSSKTVKVDLEALTKRLFAFYDDGRAKQDAEQWVAAKAKADSEAKQQILQKRADNAEQARCRLRPAAEGMHTVLGAREIHYEADPIIAGKLLGTLNTNPWELPCLAFLRAVPSPSCCPHSLPLPA